jgi:hypothetical protein
MRDAANERATKNKKGRLEGLPLFERVVEDSPEEIRT